MRSSSGTFPFRDSNGTVWLAYTDWGIATRENLLLCVHGHTRQGRDFTKLGEYFSREKHTISFDLVGHGRSGWLAKKKDYSLEISVRHIDSLMDYRGISRVDWLGTFTGGILGMIFAARDDSPIRRLILNDIGPVLSLSSIKLLLERAGSNIIFKNLEDANTYFRNVYSDCGIIDDADWSDFIIRSINREVDGTYSLHYDPAVIDELQSIRNDIDFWEVYEKIQCPVLVLRGKQSQNLSSDTAKRMTEVGPKAKVIEFDNCGLAPGLAGSIHLDMISDWLKETEVISGVEEISSPNTMTNKDENAPEIKSVTD